jgi:hypothetical protein
MVLAAAAQDPSALLWASAALQEDPEVAAAVEAAAAEARIVLAGGAPRGRAGRLATPQEVAQFAALPPGWEHVIGEDGDCYFWRTATNDVTWERPAWTEPELAAAPQPPVYLRRAPKAAKARTGGGCCAAPGTHAAPPCACAPAHRS